ncbi:MAG: OmpA family protein [Bacteroidia bacterium]
MKTTLHIITAMILLTPATQLAQQGLLLGKKAELALSASSALFNNHNGKEGATETSSLIAPGMVAAKLDGGVNTAYPEMGPIVSADGKILYFSRVQHPLNTGGEQDEEDIWYAEWNSETGSWGEAKNIGAPLNNKYPNFINSVSSDGNTLLVGNIYLPEGGMSRGVSLSHRTANGWSVPKALIIEDDISAKQLSGFCLSQDQSVLLTSREQRKDSYGDLDLYVSFIKADSTWSKPLNLGAIVNSAAAESAPFLSADKKTLFFTSESANGHGGLDIFMSRRLDDSWTNWSTPQNLGPKVNTPGDESFFSMSPDGSKLFFTSGGINDDDYDMFTMVNTGALTPVTVKETIKAVLKETSKKETNTNSAEKGLSVSFMAVYFESGKASLSSAAMNELYRISNLVSALGTAKIEISGHTDASGSPAYNAKLAAARTALVANYIKRNAHVDDSRITVTSYGESKPAADNATARGRHLNRRVEIKVTYGLMK